MVDTWLELDAKVIAVTGGGSGIGQAIVAGLRAAGAIAVVLDLSVETQLEDLAQASITTDVTDLAAVTAAIDAIVQRTGRIDGLVNNAGINLPRLLVDAAGKHPEYELNDASFDLMFNVNVKGVMFGAQAAARHMIDAGQGVIVNISSEAGLEGSLGQSAYSATKSAVNGFTRSWAKEMAPHNIRVVGVAPGINEPTGLTSPAYNEALAYTRGTTPEQLSPDYAKVIPLGRPGKLEEIADLVSYLLSPRASYITGVTIAITGGKSRG